MFDTSVLLWNLVQFLGHSRGNDYKNSIKGVEHDGRTSVLTVGTGVTVVKGPLSQKDGTVTVVSCHKEPEMIKGTVSNTVEGNHLNWDTDVPSSFPLILFVHHRPFLPFEKKDPSTYFISITDKGFLTISNIIRGFKSKDGTL